MPDQKRVVWAVIKRLIEMREQLHRDRERQNAEMRVMIEAIARPKLADCGGRRCHHSCVASL
jgi:hypothetical protein